MIDFACIHGQSFEERVVLTLGHLVLRHALIGLVLRLNLQHVSFLIHFLMVQVEFADWKGPRLLHFGARILVSEGALHADRGYLANTGAERASIVASVAHIRQLRWLNLPDLGLHQAHLVLIRRAQDAAAPILQFGAQLVPWIGLLICVSRRCSVALQDLVQRLVKEALWQQYFW